MTDIIQIECVTKRDRQNPHERIEAIGGVHNGKPWYLAENDAIAGIKTGKWTFYTSVNGRRVNVVIATHGTREYLKTEADGYVPDNLLALSACPLRRAA